MEKRLESLFWNTAQERSQVHPSAKPGSRKVKMLPSNLTGTAYLHGVHWDTFTSTETVPTTQVLDALMAG